MATAFGVDRVEQTIESPECRIDQLPDAPQGMIAGTKSSSLAIVKRISYNPSCPRIPLPISIGNFILNAYSCNLVYTRVNSIAC